ncbi:MAG TPA: hypothetical protein VF043_39570 [Ktedonobacteraceae bacterium]
MSQQQVNFDPDHRGEPPLYTTGYQDPAHDSDYSSHFSGQKLSGRDAVLQPTAGQRLALAIVSLLILFIFFVALLVVLSTGALAPNIAQDFAPALGFISLGLVAAVIVVNVVFNRKH